MSGPTGLLPKQYTGDYTSLPEEPRLLPKNNQRSFDVPKTFQPKPHEHIGRGGYKTLALLPLLSSFNPHPFE